MAPDIAALGKALGERCPHLTAENLCAVYESRPQICRDYAADWLCERIAAPTLDQRVHNYLAVFDLAPFAATAHLERAAGPKPEARSPKPPHP